MRNKLSHLVAALLTVSALSFSPLASAADVKMVGTVSKITLSANGSSATVVLKDAKTGNDVTLTVNDDETLDKFKDKRIQAGDEIRARYDDADGKNVSKSFKKTAGC